MTEPAVVDYGAGVVQSDTALQQPSRHLRRADLEVRWRWSAVQCAVVGEVCVGQDGEGLPGHVHGGLLAALCDEAMGWACWMHGYIAPGTATRFEYRAAVRAGEQLALRAWVATVDGRRLATCAEICRAERLAVLASGDYLAICPAELSAFAGWPGPERFDRAWRQKWPARGG